MFINHPYFNLDGASEGGWGDLAQSVALDEAPANDEQPVADSDAEGLEEVPAEGQDAVEPDPDEVTEEIAVEPVINDETEVELGEGRQPVKLAELKQGYLRQSDYTKKTQELAQQRTELDAERQSIEPYKGWTDFINSNPWLMQQVNAAIQEFQSTGVLPLQEALEDAQYGQYINTLLADNQRLTKETQSLQAKYGDLEFGTSMDKTISELKAEYADLITPEYEIELRQTAKTEGYKPETIKRMAKGDLAEKKLQQTQRQLKELPKKEQAKTVQSLQERRKGLPAQPGMSGQRPAAESKDVTEMSWLDLAKQVGSFKR